MSKEVKPLKEKKSMFETKCKICDDDIMENENCFGDIKDMEKICCSCFEEIPKTKRNGIVPVTRTMCEEWKQYVERFGLRT